MREYDTVLRLLPLGLPVAAPPAGAGARLLERARASGLAAPVRLPRTAAPLRPPRSWSWRRSAARLGLIAALLLLVGAVGVTLGTDPAEGTFPHRWAIPMRGAEAAPRATAWIVYEHADGHLVAEGELIVGNLPPLAPDRTYQLWYETPEGGWQSGGRFGVDARGNAAVPIVFPDGFYDMTGCGVTIEPAGGSPAPTGPNVLRGLLW